tara:strand:+ start:361 stop:939 length:579 start_codon:yes stop_codon:yes gene_type:complete
LETFFLIAVLTIIFIGIPVGIGLFIHWAIKSSGYPRAAKWTTLSYSLIVLIIGASIYFEDELFTNKDAQFYIEEQGIKLTDDFKLIENKSMSAIGDYHHTFTLEISDGDKQKAIATIKDADNFQSKNSSVDHLLYLSDNRYSGTKVIQNYETESAFVREYFEPSGQEGYAPTFRRISIDKETNELIFEDIDE